MDNAMRLTNLEREMTKKEKAKEKRLKDKYDDGDMKKSMKKQYGKDWKNVYYATIRKKAMEKMQTEEEIEEGKSLASLRNRSSFDAQNRLQNKNKIPKPKIVKPAQMDLFRDSVQNEGEAGDHYRMYKVVHAKKGMMDIKAKTSYEAAKKFAKEKGLKSTAGVDTHLYPLEEGSMSDLHARIMSADDPGDAIYKMLLGDSPEEKYIQDMYNDTSIEYGLHPDDDFEDIIDRMLDEIEGDMPFEGKNKMGPQEIMPGDRVEHEGNMYEVVEVDGFILTVDNLQTGNRTQLTMDDVTRLSGMDAMTDQDKQNADAMFKRLKKVGSGSLKHVATEGYYTMPDIDKERYTEMPGLEGPFQTKSGKPIYYDPKEGSYYDRDTDMYLTYAEFKALDEPRPETGRMKEGNSPHKKGTKKYKAHMAAMHANSVDLNAMRDALKLDESTDANTVVAQYTRACLDLSHNTWGKVCEQIDHVRSFIKEDVDVKNVRIQIRKMHEQEGLDNKILVRENIDKLKQIVKNKSAMSIKFADGSMKVDMTTANIFVQMYDKMKERNQKKIDDMMQTKAGFLKVLDFFYGAMK